MPEGNRVDPKQYDDNIPNTRSLDMPNQPANISLERITFGHVPLHTINRRIVVVQNISDECDITFKWRIPYEFGDSGNSVEIGQYLNGLLTSFAKF